MRVGEGRWVGELTYIRKRNVVAVMEKQTCSTPFHVASGISENQGKLRK